MSKFFSGSDIPWDITDEGIGQVITFGEKLSTALYKLQPGYKAPPESHPEEQGNYFLSGRAEWFVGGEGEEIVYMCEPGSLLIIGPNERHWSRLVGDEECVVLTFFSPPREAHKARLKDR